MAQMSFISLMESAAKLPLVHIDREAFLTKNLGKLCAQEKLQKALAEGTLRADIPIETLDSLANAVINAETHKVTALSAAAGIPGGFAMAATIPGDVAQFYGFVIRVAQELAYLYGWDEMFTKSSDLDEETASQLTIFIGVMFGVGVANKAMAQLFGTSAMRVAEKRIASTALTKTWYYPIAKKIATMLGQKITKESFAKSASKAVPILGGLLSGGLTFATFRPMARRLQKHLSSLARNPQEACAQYASSIIFEAEDVVDLTIVAEAVDTNFWICACGIENKGKFCTDCGNAKPVSLPQYRCDKCGWEPDDKTHPPKFCPECGDPFDDGDIILI